MATATLITPSAHYQPQPSFSSGYPHHTGASIANMISSVDPRKPSDDEPPNRQSLPSISEVISSVKTGPFVQSMLNRGEDRSYKAPSSSTQPGSLPSPFAPASRPHPDAENHASPQTLHPASFPSRQDTLPAFSDSPRPPFSSRPPLPPVSDRRPSPPTMSDIPPPQRHIPEQQKLPEQPHTMNGVYAHPPPPPQPAPAYQPGQLPAGQMPLPAYPISPRHGVPPHAPGPYDHRPPPHAEADDYSGRARYDVTVNRHFESWSYQDSLSRVSTALKDLSLLYANNS